jgi:hypothetical protein
MPRPPQVGFPHGPTPSRLVDRVGQSATGIYDYGVEPLMQTLMDSSFPNRTANPAGLLGHAGQSMASEMSQQSRNLQAADPYGFGGVPEPTQFQNRGNWFRENPPPTQELRGIGAERGQNPYPNPYPYPPPPPQRPPGPLGVTNLHTRPMLPPGPNVPNRRR